MLVVGVTEFGGPEKLGVYRVPLPDLNPSGVLVRVEAATVNPTDTLFRAGAFAQELRGRTPPFVPGMEAAGYVESVGREAAASGTSVGQRVLFMVNPRATGSGAYAEIQSVPAASLIEVPDGMDPVFGATLPMNGMTAKLAVDALDSLPGASVLVTGAAGAVGGYATQIAVSRRFRVIAVASRADLDLVSGLGAFALVERDADIVSEVRALVPTGVDAVIDAARLGDTVVPAIRDSGIFVAVRPPETVPPRGIRMSFSRVSVDTVPSDFVDLAGLIRSHVLTPRVAGTVTPSHTALAHRLLEAGGLRGRLVIRF